MQAIVTKYFGPTDHRGSRIKAVCEAGSLTVAWDYALDVEANHHAAAVALATKLGWTTEWYGDLVTGGMAGSGYCHVFGRELTLARLCRQWASESRDHGGNPHCLPFVKLARRILGE